MSGIYFDENMRCKMDLTAACWSTNKLHELYTTTIGNELSDVDWIAETESTALFNSILAYYQLKDLIFNDSFILNRYRQYFRSIL